MRLRVLVMPGLTAGLLMGCTNTMQNGTPLSPDPFGNLKSSGVCQVTPPAKGADGTMTSSMTVRSDDGRCLLPVAAPSGGSYASFGLSKSPEHGKAFLYNLNGRTQIAYTATLGYSGSDAFDVVLIPGPGQKRDQLSVTVKADATGVVIAKPPAAEPSAAKAGTAKKAASRPASKKTVRRHK